MDRSPSQSAEKRSLEFLDGVLQGNDDDVFNVANSFWSTCDFLFDAGTSGKVYNLDYGQCKESCLENFELPTFNRDGCGGEISGLPTASVAPAYPKNSALIENLTVNGLHDALRTSSGRDASVLNKEQLKHNTSFVLGDFENGSSFFKFGASSDKNGGETMILSSNESSQSLSSLFTDMSRSKLFGRDQKLNCGSLGGGDSSNNSSSDLIKAESNTLGAGTKDAAPAEKRSRKPPRRYIEEPLEQNSRHRKWGSSYKDSRDKVMRVKLGKRHCQKGFSRTHSLCEDESFAGPCIQVPFGLPVEKRCPKKSSSFLGYELQNQNNGGFLNEKSDAGFLSTAPSQDEGSDDVCSRRMNMEMVRARRKHHKLWTLSEVMKLIEGVSQYGVGRWTEIKRLLFPSTHRTSVDLKDKWRNLLKVSCMKLTKKQVEHGRKQASHQMPQAVLGRVRELALMHPYPRDRKPKALCSAPVSAPIPSTANMVPISAAVGV